MLDRLLGRAELRDRIAELEGENERLRRQLDAESERRSEAVTGRQRAEERVNRLEDRIEELEDRVERAENDDAPEPSFRRVETVRGRRLGELLDRLDSLETGPEGVLTAFVDDDPPGAVREAFGDRARLVRRAAPAVVVVDDAGMVSAALRPPIEPEPFCAWDDRVRIDDGWFRPAGRFAFGLVSADAFAFGVYDGDDRVSFEGFESDVKGNHSKGGFSQSRFERLRDEQLEAHLDDVREALSEHDAERTLLVGDRAALAELEAFADATATVDERGADRGALDAAFRSFWSTRVYGI